MWRILINLQGDYQWSGMNISFKFKSLRDVIDLCSFSYWKTGNLLTNPSSNAFEKLIVSWQEYKMDLNRVFWDNIKSWQETDLLYV